jgi:uncharacterized protein YbjT (DUF2867 family)
MMSNTAIILGATGLVGRHLVNLLLDDTRYKQVKVFVRRPLGFEHPKLVQHVIDFDHPEEWQELVTGDALFSCLGTTIRAAGSREIQYKVDYTYQYRGAKIAAGNGVSIYVLVSSSGANSASKFFYPRIKGELDRDVEKLPFHIIRILKPSVLAGERQEKRPGESLAVVLGNLLIPLIPPLKKYRPIPAAIVAKAMINAANDTTPPGLCEFELAEVFALATKEVP